MRLPRPLDAVETRVLGALLEKELLTPDVYPMTLPALLAACNQRTSREPVTELSAAEATAALDRLREPVLVWKVTGGRAEKWEHNLDQKWQAGRPEKALLALLLLRGPQTAAELRINAERWHRFADSSSVEAFLNELAERSDERGGPLALLLPRAPGAREARWMHLLCGPIDVQALQAAQAHGGASASPALQERVQTLEEQVAQLQAQVARLCAELGVTP